ncbi:MAG: hypothetical protein ACOCSC_01940, partial [Candidatus Hadarchaeota archaeon]
QERIKVESEAVLQILNKCQVGVWDLLGSEALDFELSKIEDAVRRYKVSRLYSLAEQKIKVDKDVEKRAKELKSSGFAALDGLHIVCAETGGAEVMLTPTIFNKVGSPSRIKGGCEDNEHNTN